MLYPYKMMPIYKDYIWGGHNLRKLEKPAPEGKVAESWELSAISGSESIIANGPLQGKTLTEAIKKYGKSVLGEKIASDKTNSALPVLLKFIDASDRISIQVHPDDDYALKHEHGKLGKTEMWYIIDAEPDATVIHGFIENHDKEKIRQAILDEKHDGLYREFKVKKGDVVFIPAGTVHALNGGVVIAEIQQHSDLTYRLFDYNRTDAAGNKRPLHINKALDVLNYNSRKALFHGISLPYEKAGIKYLAISDYFCVKLIESKGAPVEMTTTEESFTAFMFIQGEAEIISNGEKVHAGALETVLIPAFMGSYTLDGDFSALQIFIPNSVYEEYNYLTEMGFSHNDIINGVAGAENLYASLKTIA
ncbi:MAG TPA: class I mannose-6-phosphate isomerase [Acetivibrio clariflavus]|nr:class I mannose-6-phosphate isomerase [Acetivibrio clariflavus]